MPVGDADCRPTSVGIDNTLRRVERETHGEMGAATDALTDALAADDGYPDCSVCPADADFYLFAPGRVSRFVCWEHVSPYAAEVDPDDVPEPGGGHALDRPVAIPL